MANLLEETLERMKGVGLGPEDIVFIGSADNEYSMSGWREFEALADVEYDDGYPLGTVRRSRFRLRV